MPEALRALVSSGYYADESQHLRILRLRSPSLGCLGRVACLA